jgi:hypothetical protein
MDGETYVNITVEKNISKVPDSGTNEQLPVQSVSITTKVVSTNPVHGVVYSIQHYVIKFVSDLRQVGGFLWFSPPLKLIANIKALEILNFWLYYIRFKELV